MKPVCLPEKYEIIGELGSGGMGLVYHARDRVLDREVALKVLSSQLAANPDYVQRFLTEARAAASLNHPNIVQIYDFGKTGNGHYLAMELIRGHSLKAELKKVGRFSEAHTIELVLTACRTLGVAHRAGIVHRDVKPDNMMFTENREFKLVDLGYCDQRVSIPDKITYLGHTLANHTIKWCCQTAFVEISAGN